MVRVLINAAVGKDTYRALETKVEALSAELVERNEASVCISDTSDNYRKAALAGIAA